MRDGSPPTSSSTHAQLVSARWVALTWPSLWPGKTGTIWFLLTNAPPPCPQERLRALRRGPTSSGCVLSFRRRAACTAHLHSQSGDAENRHSAMEKPTWCRLPAELSRRGAVRPPGSPRAVVILPPASGHMCAPALSPVFPRPQFWHMRCGDGQKCQGDGHTGTDVQRGEVVNGGASTRAHGRGGN